MKALSLIDPTDMLSNTMLAKLFKELAPRLDLSVRDFAGNSLLHAAATGSSIITALLADVLQCDCNAVNHAGQTPLLVHMASNFIPSFGLVPWMDDQDQRLCNQQAINTGTSGSLWFSQPKKYLVPRVCHLDDTLGATCRVLTWHPGTLAGRTDGWAIVSAERRNRGSFFGGPNTENTVKRLWMGTTTGMNAVDVSGSSIFHYLGNFLGLDDALAHHLLRHVTSDELFVRKNRIGFAPQHLCVGHLAAPRPSLLIKV
jgi:hypothetical protein